MTRNNTTDRQSMPGPARPTKSPLRRRFIISIGMMLLPFLVLTATGYLLFQSVIASFEEIKEEALDELLPVMRIQLLMHKAVMPPNDYLIHGDRREHAQFLRLSAEVDAAFEGALRLPFKLDEEKRLIRELHKAWTGSRQKGERLFSYAVRPADRRAVRAMELFDASIDETDRLFQAFISTIDQELHDEQKKVAATRRAILLLIAAILLLGLVLTLATGIVLARSVLNPVRALEQGVERFTAGQYSHRVAVADNHEFGHLAAAFNEMAEAIERNARELEELSLRDGLTGLSNRRAFGLRLSDETARARRYQGVYSFLMIDIDHFKAVNDKYGHQAGDDVLQAVAATVSEQIRAVDFAARYGGEEFAVLLPHTTGANGIVVAERIRRAIEALPLPITDGVTARVTVSIGVASFPDNAETGEKLVQAADNALYQAKEAGRNKVSRA